MDITSALSAFEAIQIAGFSTFHIHSVEVFLGDDDSREVDSLSMIPSPNQGHLVVSRKVYTAGVEKTDLRMRGEPGVKLYFSAEDQPETTLCMTLAHHKGSIMMRVTGLK